jgi:hypothetical protein
MRKMFLSDRKPKDIMKSIMEDQVIPGIKDNFRNSFVSSLDMFIYDGAKTVSQSSTTNHISYNSMYQKQQANKPYGTNNTQSKTDIPDEPAVNNSFSNPTFKYRHNTDPKNIGAENFLAAIKSREYPTFSVMDLYSMQGKVISWTWEVWGWNKEELQNLKISRINNPEKPYVIEFPPAHQIT